MWALGVSTGASNWKEKENKLSRHKVSLIWLPFPNTLTSYCYSLMVTGCPSATGTWVQDTWIRTSLTLNFLQRFDLVWMLCQLNTRYTNRRQVSRHRGASDDADLLLTHNTNFKVRKQSHLLDVVPPVRAEYNVQYTFGTRKYKSLNNMVRLPWLTVF